MNRHVKRLLLATALVTPVLFWLGASAQPAGVPTWVSDPRVLEAAKKEGSVVHYCTLPQAYCEDIAKRFEKHTGIKAEITRSSSGPQYNRIMQEHQAGLKVTDVVENALVASFVEMKVKGMLEPYLPRDAARIDERYRDRDRMFSEYYVNVQFIAYNPKIISAAEAPKGWKDIYDPKWKGKLSVGHPKFSGIAVDWVLWQSKLFGWEFLTRLKANDPFIPRSLAEAIPVLINGERPLNGESYGDVAWEAKLKGQPIEIVYPEEGVIVSHDYTAILKSAPHPNAAKVFVDYLFSQENAQWLIERYVYVTHPTAKGPAGFRPLSDLKTLVLDPAEVNRETQNVRDRFSAALGG
jgi:iron(III) transport system substrate-binding protein